MLTFEKITHFSISLNNYMTLKNKENKKYSFWEHFNQTLNKCISAENNVRKNKNSEYFLLITKQAFPHRHLENLSGEYGR